MKIAELRIPLELLPGFSTDDITSESRVTLGGALYLDLASHREALLRYIAYRLGLDTKGATPKWKYVSAERGWMLECGVCPIFKPTTDRDDLDPYVPALAGLDPLWDNRLADGYRVVDALALRYSALYTTKLPWP